MAFCNEMQTYFQNSVKSPADNNEMIVFVTVESEGNQNRNYIMEAIYAFIQNGYLSVIVVNNLKPLSKCKEQDNIEVWEVGNWIPKSFFGYFRGLFYKIRSAYTALYTASEAQFMRPALVIVDASCVTLPILRNLGSYNVVTFEYFREVVSTTFWTVPRPIRNRNFIHSWFTSFANEVLVPSKHAQAALTMNKRIYKRNVTVLYPPTDCEHIEYYHHILHRRIIKMKKAEKSTLLIIFVTSGVMDVESNFDLLITAFGHLIEKLNEEWQSRVILNILGNMNYEEKSHKSYRKYIEALINSLPYSAQINLFTNVSLRKKCMSYASCKAVVNANEISWFNWCIVEALYFGRPLITLNSGFAREIIVDRFNGFFVKKTAEEFAELMYQQLSCSDDVVISVSKEAALTYDNNFAASLYSQKFYDLLFKYTTEETQIVPQQFFQLRTCPERTDVHESNPNVSEHDVLQKSIKKTESIQIIHSPHKRQICATSTQTQDDIPIQEKISETDILYSTNKEINSDSSAENLDVVEFCKKKLEKVSKKRKAILNIAKKIQTVKKIDSNSSTELKATSSSKKPETSAVNSKSKLHFDYKALYYRGTKKYLKSCDNIRRLRSEAKRLREEGIKLKKQVRSITAFDDTKNPNKQTKILETNITQNQKRTSSTESLSNSTSSNSSKKSANTSTVEKRPKSCIVGNRPTVKTLSRKTVSDVRLYSRIPVICYTESQKKYVHFRKENRVPETEIVNKKKVMSKSKIPVLCAKTKSH